MAHANARLGPAGRRQLVALMIERGMTERQAAACLSVAPTTAHRWKHRWLQATATERASGAWTAGRCSRPHRSPARTASAIERRVCAERQRTGWGPRLIAGTTGVAHSTVHAILRRHGLSRVPKAPREAVVRFEWPCPGDLLQMDTKRFARFTRPVIASLVIATARAPRSAHGSVGSSVTRSSTTTRASPTANCTTTSARPPSSPLCAAR